MSFTNNKRKDLRVFLSEEPYVFNSGDKGFIYFSKNRKICIVPGAGYSDEDNNRKNLYFYKVENDRPLLGYDTEFRCFGEFCSFLNDFEKNHFCNLLMNIKKTTIQRICGFIA